MDERSTEGRRKSGPITAIFITQAARVKAMGSVEGNGLGSTFAVWASAAPCLRCVVARTRALQKAIRLSNDPQCYWQLPRRRLPSRAALVCRRHFRIFRQVADTSPPRAEGNHPNPCLPWRVRPLLMAQGIRIRFAVDRRAPSPPNRLGTYLNRPDVPGKLPRSWRFRDG